MLRIAAGLIGIVALVTACAQTTTGTLSAADSCTQQGGVWRLPLAMCDRSAGGGGGY